MEARDDVGPIEMPQHEPEQQGGDSSLAEKRKRFLHVAGASGGTRHRRSISLAGPAASGRSLARAPGTKRRLAVNSPRPAGQVTTSRPPRPVSRRCDELGRSQLPRVADRPDGASNAAKSPLSRRRRLAAVDEAANPNRQIDAAAQPALEIHEAVDETVPPARRRDRALDPLGSVRIDPRGRKAGKFLRQPERRIEQKAEMRLLERGEARRERQTLELFHIVAAIMHEELVVTVVKPGA